MNLDLNKVLENVINVAFLFLGKYLKKYRTAILSVLAIVIGAWEWIAGNGLFEFLCKVSDTVKFLMVFCDITEAKFYAIILIVMGALNAILRRLTEMELNPNALRKENKVVRYVAIFGGLVLVATVFALIF